MIWQLRRMGAVTWGARRGADGVVRASLGGGAGQERARAAWRQQPTRAENILRLTLR